MIGSRVPIGRRLGASLILLALVAACVHTRARSGPDVWPLRGAVVSVTETTLRVRHKSGQIIDVRLDGYTQYVHREHPDYRESLHTGVRVLVEVETVQRDSYRARVVRIG